MKDLKEIIKQAKYEDYYVRTAEDDGWILEYALLNVEDFKKVQRKFDISYYITDIKNEVTIYRVNEEDPVREFIGVKMYAI